MILWEQIFCFRFQTFQRMINLSTKFINIIKMSFNIKVGYIISLFLLNHSSMGPREVFLAIPKLICGWCSHYFFVPIG